MTAPKKPGKSEKQSSSQLAPEPSTVQKPTDKTGTKSGAAAEAAKRLAKMTPEEQAAELFKSMLAATGKKSR